MSSSVFIAPFAVIHFIFLCSSREEAEEDYVYAVYTRVPLGFKGMMPCHRIEQSYRVGPLVVNREAVLRTATDLRNNKTIFTDNNGYQMQKRPHRTFANNTVARVCRNREIFFFFFFYLGGRSLVGRLEGRWMSFTLANQHITCLLKEWLKFQRF